MSFYERYQRATLYFEAKDFVTAARLLAELVVDAPDDLALRLSLARAYYHSAQLGRAETQLRHLLDRDPVHDYAHLMLGRTLQRQGRATEATTHLRLAEAMTRTAA